MAARALIGMYNKAIMAGTQNAWLRSFVAKYSQAFLRPIWRRYTTYGYIMLQQKLIKLIRSEMLDGLVNEYCDSFSSVDVHTVDDKEFAELVKFWRSCDDQQKGFIRSLMRFSSQNSLASLLALIDNSSFCYEAKNELGVNEFKLNAETSQGGVSLEQDLTDVFWEQEQEDGHVK